jgi:hypothetical protein
MSKPKMNKKSVALFLSKKSVPQIIADANLYVDQMNGNADFPNPVPSLSTIQIQVAQVQTAYTVAQTRQKGAVSAMYSVLKVLEVSLKQLASYVETVANADPDLAESIILSAGMTVKKTAVRAPKIFSVKQGITGEEVILNNKALKRAAYIYQLSTDPSKPDTWEIIYSGLRVKYIHKGLTPGIRYYFKTTVISKDGAIDNPAILSLITS